MVWTKMTLYGGLYLIVQLAKEVGGGEGGEAAF